MTGADGENSNHSPFHYVKIWDPCLRLWHWLLAISVISGWLLGEFRTFSIMQWHFYCGYLTLCLLLLRFIWGFVGPPTARLSTYFSSPKRLIDYSKTLFNREPSALAGHNPLGGLSAAVLLLLLTVQVATGLFSEDDGLFHSGPFAWMLSSAMVVKFTAVHNLFAKLVLVFVLLHLAAILFYLFWKKENLIKPMITGAKLVKRKDKSQGQG